jgi:RNA polymerase sigma factor (sigma-70 family)
VHDDESDASALVADAASGDQRAWNSIVHRYTPLILSIAGRFRLDPHDVADVAQTVWLRLVQHLSSLREPDALPGWIATTTRNEALRVAKGRGRVTLLDPLAGYGNGSPFPDDTAADEVEDRMLAQQRHEAFLTAFGELSDRQRELLLLLLTNPPPSYADISARLDIPIGAIGPTRARALDRLRRSPALADLFDTDAAPVIRNKRVRN